MNEKTENKMSKKVKIIIAVLCSLIVLSVGALAAQIIYFKFFAENTSTVVVPDNLLGKDTQESVSSDINSQITEKPSSPAVNTQKNAAVIELDKGQSDDNERFQVHNMLPGDTEIKYFAIKVSHSENVAVYFNAEVTQQTKNFANILNIKVTNLENDRVIYNGSFENMAKDGYSEIFTVSQGTQTVVYYKIEVSLPAKAGNEYQNASLYADFDWSVKESDALTSPSTSATKGTVLLTAVFICLLMVLTVLLLLPCKKKEDKNAR